MGIVFEKVFVPHLGLLLWDLGMKGPWSEGAIYVCLSERICSVAETA